MQRESSLNDVFRFIQLRPPVSLNEVSPAEALPDTEFAQSLAEAPDAQRRIELADQTLEDGKNTVQRPADVLLGQEIATALSQLRGTAASTAELIQRLDGFERYLAQPEFEYGRRRLSDTLLASLFATRGLPAELAALQDVYRVFDHLRRHGGSIEAASSLPLRQLLARPILSPLAPAPPREASAAPNGGGTGGAGTTGMTGMNPPPVPAQPPVPVRERLSRAVEELTLLQFPAYLVQPGQDGAEARAPFTLTERATERLSDATRALLAERWIDLATTPLAAILSQLTAEVQLTPDPLASHSVTHLPGSLPTAPRAHIRPAGLADLLVVKQQIKRYETGEIAHVENVLAGEKKSRSHRLLERSEETFSRDLETAREQRRELETADRFELNREASQVLREDQQTGFGLSLSGKYGPAVEFSSNFEMDRQTAAEETARSASQYARNVVERSLERLSEKVREQRIRKVLREAEETNLHELHNETGAHSSGIYQYLDKVYEAQVFHYGVRQMFDFMVPEPASFLWWMEGRPNPLSLPPPPEPLERFAPSAAAIQESTYRLLAARYGALDVEPPPPAHQMIAVGLDHGKDEKNDSEKGEPRSLGSADVQVPEGYIPSSAKVRCLALTDDDPVIGIQIGAHNVVWKPQASDRVPLPDQERDHALAHAPVLSLALGPDTHELTGESKLRVAAVAWETYTYSINVEIVCMRSARAYAGWQLGTYEKIRSAYNDRKREYEQAVAELRAEAEARAERAARQPFGAPPSENRKTILNELKKHCVSIVTRQRYDAFGAVQEPANQPPQFDWTRAEAEGTFIRFFEQAFEWDQMQYVFYPYFWGRKPNWTERFARQEVDPQMQEFLQAGAARVVVPVRPGFEAAVSHYLETGKLWGGTGEPPAVNSPLYVPILDEIRERTGASRGEVAVGEPWEVRMPTSLVLLRDGASLPRWERAGENWEWRPAASEDGGLP